jgi:hypothetical protein
MRSTKQSHDAAPPPALPGYAALAREEVADAKRRRPDADLRPYALRCGLAFHGSATPAGWEQALPHDEQLQFNVLHGPAGGRDSCLFHWVKPWPVMPDGDPGVGTFHGRVWRPPVARQKWWKLILDPSYLPYVGWLFDFRSKPAGPSYRNAIGVPCTAATTLVPEAAGLPWVTIDNFAKPGVVGCHREKLKERGLTGWTLLAGMEPSPAVVERLLTPQVRGVLGRAARLPFFELRVRDGAVTVARNGYVTRDADLDELLEAAAIVGDALRDACAEPRSAGSITG